MANIEEFVNTYYHMGLQNKEILSCLAHLNGIIISIKTLKRLTKKMRLFRRMNHSDLLEVATYVLQQCDGSGQLHGYRWMHAKCVANGFRVNQETIRILLQIIDSEGCQIRTARRLRRRVYRCAGPNAVWHIDGYDKIKPYGICIHGCIDAYSRNIIWLEACTTNNNPHVIAGYFVESVRELDGCPERIRADAGTENVDIEQMQVFLRADHADRFSGPDSFQYGTSTSNQRIESLWSILRKECIQFWMNTFQTLRESGYHDGGYLDKQLIAFCFMKMVQVRSCHVLRSVFINNSYFASWKWYR